MAPPTDSAGAATTIVSALAVPTTPLAPTGAVHAGVGGRAGPTGRPASIGTALLARAGRLADADAVQTPVSLGAWSTGPPTPIGTALPVLASRGARACVPRAGPVGWTHAAGGPATVSSTGPAHTIRDTRRGGSHRSGGWGSMGVVLDGGCLYIGARRSDLSPWLLFCGSAGLGLGSAGLGLGMTRHGQEASKRDQGMGAHHHLQSPDCLSLDLMLSQEGAWLDHLKLEAV